MPRPSCSCTIIRAATRRRRRPTSKSRVISFEPDNYLRSKCSTTSSLADARRNGRRITCHCVNWGIFTPRVRAKKSTGQEAYFEQNDPHPDPLPSDGRGNRQPRLSQHPKRLDAPTYGGRFSLTHPMGEGRGEGERASKSEVVFARVLSTPFHKCDHVCCADFRFWRGATREHPPKWGCDEEQRGQNRKATQPSGRRFFSAHTSLLAPYRPLQGMRVARASSGPQLPRRKR